MKNIQVSEEEITEDAADLNMAIKEYQEQLRFNTFDNRQSISKPLEETQTTKFLQEIDHLYALISLL